MEDLRARLAGQLKAAFESDAPYAALFADDCPISVAYPVNELTGGEAARAHFLEPLKRALPHAVRRDLLVLGGRSRSTEGMFVAFLSHYCGLMRAPLFGVPACGRLVALRCGEFYRIEDGRIVEARILPDLIDLMHQVGLTVVPPLLGTELMFPAPATMDGVCPNAPERSDAAAKLVRAMLTDLHPYDPQTFQSPNMTGADGYWADEMFWYGPGGIGSTFSYEGFDTHHRVAFLKAFPDRKGGNHFAFLADGDYVASGGWPSMTMTHAGDYLGVPATGNALTCRVMDFWRCEGPKIVENWVLIDMVHLFQQMGRDLLAELPREV